MALQIWLPLNGDLHNQGLIKLPNTSVDTFTYNVGKIGQCGTGRAAWHLSEEILGNIWSVALWIKPISLGSNNNILFCKNNTGSTDCQIYFSIISTTQLNLGVNGPSSSISKTGLTFAADTWYHVAATYDGNTAILYLNGNEVKRGTITTAMPTGRLNININGRSTNAANTTTTGNFNSSYNDFRLYNHCLSAKEVAEIAKGLVLHYQLNRPNPNIVNGVLLGKAIKTVKGDDYNNGQWCNLSGGNGTVSAIQDNTAFIGKYIYRISNNTSGNKDIAQYNTNPKFTLTSGQKYTMSAYYRGKCNVLMRVWDGTNGKQLIGLTQSIDTGNEWLRIIKSFTATDAMTGTNNIGFLFGLSGSSNGNVDICGMKVEMGENATELSPSKLEYNYNIIYDSSGYNHNGIINGDLLTLNVSPKNKYNLSFTSNTISLSPIFYDNTNQCHTVSAWIYPTTTTDATLINFNNGYKLFHGSTGKTLMYLNGGTNDSYVYGSALPTNTWTFLTWVLDTSNQTCKVYYNGILNASSANYTNTDIPSGINKNLTMCSGFNGQLSDFRIYATALTADQIKELYNSSMNIVGTNKVPRGLE